MLLIFFGLHVSPERHEPLLIEEDENARVLLIEQELQRHFYESPVCC